MMCSCQYSYCVTGRQYTGGALHWSGDGIWWSGCLLLDAGHPVLQDVQPAKVTGLVSTDASHPLRCSCHLLLHQYPLNHLLEDTASGPSDEVSASRVADLMSIVDYPVGHCAG